MPRIIVVEDEESIRELLRRVLVDAGYDVALAPDAPTALTLAAEASPDVMFLDLNLPGANGLWLADQIREQHPTTAMVLATADAAVPPYQSLRRGIVGYLLKPFRRADVIRVAEEAVRWSQDARRR
jgi:CheY-like chemotaxis protein